MSEKQKNLRLDPTVSQFGREACEPLHTYGPAVRDFYLMHFIVDGQGSFFRDDDEYRLRAGQGFLIRPGEITRYSADSEDPWTYFWIGFRGQSAERLLDALGLDRETPVFSFVGPEIVETAWRTLDAIDGETLSSQFLKHSVLFSLLSAVRPGESLPQPAGKRLGGRKEYVERAIRYFHENYASPITVAGVARSLGLNRSYFSSLFCAHTKSSPSQYLLKLRMEEATRLLGDPRLSVTEVAKSVGYADPLLFSRTFKRETGFSPRAFRKAYQDGEFSFPE